VISAVASLLAFLRRKRRAWEDSLNKAGLAHTLSPARHRLHKVISRSIDQYAHGCCLDAGCGHSPFKNMLREKGTSVVGIDVEDRAGKTDHIADLQGMPQVENGTFDTVLCTQVLEHLPRPWDALRELSRVSRPHGMIIVTVPHLSIIHEAPHDYYRYTSYGLRALASQAELEVVDLQPTGGLFVFLGHSASLVLMCTLGAVPGLGWFTWLVNYIVFVRLAELVDRVCGMPSLYPCDYLLIARKLPTDVTP
jgi:SAM-dependent methyltransferase